MKIDVVLALCGSGHFALGKNFTPEKFAEKSFFLSSIFVLSVL